jgi:hypothetical protein
MSSGESQGERRSITGAIDRLRLLCYAVSHPFAPQANSRLEVVVSSRS